MGLVGSSWSESDPVVTCKISRLWTTRATPRSPAGTHTCTVVYRRVPCVPSSRKCEQRPAAGGEKLCIPANIIYIYILLEEMTQVSVV